MNVCREYRLKHRGFSAAVWAAAMVAVAGCGSGVKTVPVTGAVTFSGKQPPHPCLLNFVPLGVELSGGGGQAGIEGPVSGVGECNATGEYSAKCLRDRIGLMPGRYEVIVSCYLPNKDAATPPVSVINAGFKAPELVVPADARSVRYDLDVPVTKKK
jgi:hypothetical protein